MMMMMMIMIMIKWSSRWNENWQENPKLSEKTYSSATLSTTNPTRTDLGSNLGRRGGGGSQWLTAWAMTRPVTKSIYLSIYLCTIIPAAPTWSIGHQWKTSFHFSFLILDNRKDSLDGDSARRKATNYTGQQTQNKLRQTTMPWVGFEPIIPTFERAKTFHALDRAATVIDKEFIGTTKLLHTNCDGSVSEVNDYFLNDRHSISDKRRSSHRHSSQSAPWLTRPPIQWVTRVLRT
jgi:hypothetical protein